MQIKVFKASSMREAVAQMKQELGENAVILHTKKYKDGGFLGMGSREMIELTAAIEDEKPPKKELPTEKIDTAPSTSRPTSVVSQYKMSGTPEGIALAERTQQARAAADGARPEPPPYEDTPDQLLPTVEPSFAEALSEAETAMDSEPSTVESSLYPTVDSTVYLPAFLPTDSDSGVIDSDAKLEPSTDVGELSSEAAVERVTEILTAAMSMSSTVEPVPQSESETQAEPLPTELSNLTAEEPHASESARSEQLTSAPPVDEPTPQPSTVTLTAEQLAQMQAAMVAQAVAQLQMTPPQPAAPPPTPVPQPTPAPQPSSPTPPAPSPDGAQSEADRASEEKIQRLESEIAQMKAMLAKVLGRDVSRGTVTLHEALRQQEVSEEILNDMAVNAGAGETLADCLSVEARSTLLNYLRANMLFSDGIKLNRHGVRIAALLGTTGVGKTTTLAKIAAKFVLENQVSAALITADTYRISAVEQLRTYSDILGLPLEIVYTPGELSKAIMKHRSKDLILIDTAGRSQHNDDQMRELRELLSINQRIEKHLVLSVTTKQTDAAAIIEKFSVCEPDKIIFTKTDETGTLGSIVNLLARQQRLALSYLTNGQSVPDDILTASAENLSGLLLRAVP